MKRKLREKNSIIISFVFYLILIIFIGLFFILNTSDKLDKINNKKTETQDLYNKIKTISNE